jgi:putative intracellular protease/amidase
MKNKLKLIIFISLIFGIIFTQSEPKILIVITNTEIDNQGHNTGFWFSELTHFIDVFKNTNYQFEFISPNGGNVPIDLTSLESLDIVSKNYYKDNDFLELLKNTKRPIEIDINEFSVIYYVGGHGAMWDFPNNNQLQKITTQIYENNGIVSAVCHGTAGLLNVKLSNGKYLIDNKKVTGFSNFEETIVGKSKSIPFLLQDQIEIQNANYDKNLIPFTSNIIIDRRIITGQNPNSTTDLAKAILNWLNL